MYAIRSYYVDVIGFTAIENLVGTADTQDGFVFLAEGSLSGSITGGAGGPDGFVVENGEDGSFTRVNPDASGAGTVSLHGKTVNYSGMEPILDGTDADRIINASIYDDTLILEDADNSTTGTMQVRSLAGDFYDAATGTLISAVAFTNPLTSLTFNLGSYNFV